MRVPLLFGAKDIPHHSIIFFNLSLTNFAVIFCNGNINFLICVYIFHIRQYEQKHTIPVTNHDQGGLSGCGLIDPSGPADHPRMCGCWVLPEILVEGRRPGFTGPDDDKVRERHLIVVFNGKGATYNVGVGVRISSLLRCRLGRLLSAPESWNSQRRTVHAQRYRLCISTISRNSPPSRDRSSW